MARLAGQRAAELGVWLRAWISDRGSSSTEVSRRLACSASDLERALDGELPLELVTVFAILAALGERPNAFLKRHYPLSGRRPADPDEEPEEPEAPEEPEEPDEPTLQALAELVESRQPVLSPAEWAEKAARLLRRSIARAGTDERAVGRALGLPSGALSKLLGQPRRLTSWHLFSALAAIGMTPGRFVAEFCSPTSEEGVSQEQRAQFWDALEPLLLGALGAEEESEGEEPGPEEAGEPKAESTGEPAPEGAGGGKPRRGRRRR